MLIGSARIQKAITPHLHRTSRCGPTSRLPSNRQRGPGRSALLAAQRAASTPDDVESGRPLQVCIPGRRPLSWPKLIQIKFRNTAGHPRLLLQDSRDGQTGRKHRHCSPHPATEDKIMEARSAQAKPDPNEKLGEPGADPSRAEAVDRPGFDLGGSTGKTSAGTGLGLGEDAADTRRDRRLPGRRGDAA